MQCTIEQLSFSVNLCANFFILLMLLKWKVQKIKIKSVNFNIWSKCQLLKHSLLVNVFHESGQYSVIL
jgi:hypothetical protein